MATLVAYSDSDGSGRASSTTYSTARAMTSPTVYATELGDPVGQGLSGSTYTCYENFYSFDTSSLGAAALVESATLQLYLRTDSSTTDFTNQVYMHDWGGGTIGTGDVVAGADLGGKTKVASIGSSGIGAAGLKSFTSVAAFPTNVSKTGNTRIIVASSRQEAGTTPTGNEYIDWGFQELSGGTSDDPVLTVVYYTPAFGMAIDGTDTIASSNDRKRVSQATPASSGTVTKLTGRVSLNSAGSTVAKAVIYSDSGGAPNALLATSDEVTVNFTTEAATDFAFSGGNQISITASTPYWIGIHYQDPGTPTFRIGCDATANGHQTASDTYSDGPASSFGTPTAQTGILDVWVTYTEGGSTVVKDLIMAGMIPFAR